MIARAATLSLALLGCGTTTYVVPALPDAAADVSTPDASTPDVAASDIATAADVAPTSDAPLARFSFFITSWRALQVLSGSANGFGGDLRYGETGPGAGLRGADRICAAIAERSMPGAGRKQWRAFLSATNGGDGNPVHAIDRVGEGPWYDRLERVVAANRAALPNLRPTGAHPAIFNDLPNEDGVPNHRPDPSMGLVDNHHMLTGSTTAGRLYGMTATCLDWTSARGDRATEGRPRCGLSWPRGGGGGGPGGSTGSAHWISALDEAGCAPGAALFGMGGPVLSNPTVGSGGGYGGFYCFALTP